MLSSSISNQQQGLRETQSIELTKNLSIVYSFMALTIAIVFKINNFNQQSLYSLLVMVIFILTYNLIRLHYYLFSKVVLTSTSLFYLTYLSLTVGETTHVQWLMGSFISTIFRIFSGESTNSLKYTYFFSALSSVLLIFCIQQTVFAPPDLSNDLIRFFNWSSTLAFLAGSGYSTYYWHKLLKKSDVASNEMQVFLKTLLDHLPISIITSNPQKENEISFWNKASDVIFGQKIDKLKETTNEPSSNTYGYTSNGVKKILKSTQFLVKDTLLLKITEDITERENILSRLQENEAFLSTLIQSTSVGVFLVNSRGVCSFVNPAMESLLMYSANEMIDQKWYGALTEQEFKKIKYVWEDYINQKKEFKETTQLFRRDGSDFWCLVQFSPAYNESGDIDFHVGTITDVSNFKNIEHEILKIKSQLELTNLQLNSLFDNMTEGAVVQDATGMILQANFAARKILGLEMHDLIYKNSKDESWNAIHEDGSPYPGIEHPAMLALQTGKLYLNKVMGLKGDKITRWININSVPIFEDNSKQPTKVISTFSDITEMRELEHRNEIIRERLLISTQAMKFGVWDWDVKNNKLVWDDFLYEVYGVNREEFQGDYDAFEKTLLESEKPRVMAELNKAFANRENFSSEFLIKSKTDGGQNRVIKSKAKAFYSNDGTILRLVGANWDVTHEKIQEQKLIHSSKMSNLGEMSAGIAHEINNPLSVILSRAYILKNSIEKNNFNSDKMYQEVNKIYDNCLRISKIIKGLKAFARDGQNDPMEPIPLRDIIENAQSICNSKIIEKGITFNKDEISPELQVNCSSTQLTQVFVNLLSNSIDAITDLADPWISIKIKVDSTLIRILIIDSGSGIKEEIREKIMLPFFTTKSANKGTGLGLSISSSIIKSHQGTLGIDSAHPNTCFYIELPLYIE